MDLVGNPQMITYHAGGNNCGFGDVVKNCIYQPDPSETYGDYPGPGLCAESLGRSNDYINKPGEGGLYYDEVKTLMDVLGHDAVRDNDNFRLYVLGYAHFFNLGANYCDDISFGPLRHRPKLSNQLRTDINDGVERVNQVLARAVGDFTDPRITFIDISPAFNGHRFCENSHSYQDQWYSTDVWLWNLNTPADDPPADPALINGWLNGGSAMADISPDAGLGVEMQGGVETDGSGGSTGQPTWFQRPFHPKKGGTQAIANIVIAQALADKIPGVVGS
ncbi:SGNH hydrolase-type esterase domain-containing protein [Xylaria palmicola]|nr:SGNH hydrolase-type esterase domain-containing protein [Xylaria palmicola]